MALHWKILIGMLLGLIFGALVAGIGKPSQEETKLAKIKMMDLIALKEQRVELQNKIQQLKLTSGQNANQISNKQIAQIVAAENQFAQLDSEIKQLQAESSLAISSGTKFINDWVSPFGTIFINLLKLIAVPLILGSLIKGISDLQDIAKFRKMGIRTVALYIATTVVAICIGLFVVNLVEPGSGISEQTINELTAKYSGSDSVKNKLETASSQKTAGPLQPLVDMFPSNIFKAMANNGLMLQVISFSILFGICLLLVKEELAKPMKEIFSSLNEVILKMVDIIMLTAPFAVFALLASVVANSDDPKILVRLLYYALTVIGGLVAMLSFYLILVSVIGKKNPIQFIQRILPAQLTALSTSSSAATLPVTLERVTEHVGVDEEVAGFVLPVGATINMDGTSLYQAVAAVFVAQALSFDLSFSMQITIVVTALLASIGSAAVPGAGMVMLIIVLQSIGFPENKFPIALALIFAVDRPLDMIRTMVNVTGDATVSLIVAKSLGKINIPKVKNWDDNYKVEG